MLKRKDYIPLIAPVISLKDQKLLSTRIIFSLLACFLQKDIYFQGHHVEQIVLRLVRYYQAHGNLTLAKPYHLRQGEWRVFLLHKTYYLQKVMGRHKEKGKRKRKEKWSFVKWVVNGKRENKKKGHCTPQAPEQMGHKVKIATLKVHG